jgi:hypothetical protein
MNVTEIENDPRVLEVRDKLLKVVEGLPRHKQIEVIQRAADMEQEVSSEKRRALAAIQELRDWVNTNPPVRLEKNDCSRLHNFKDALRARRVIGYENVRLELPIVFELQHTFVVKHDWASAFESADGIDDGFRLPYDFCAFEFRITGHTVILIAKQEADDHISYQEFIETQDYWYAPPLDSPDFTPDATTQLLINEVRAICIALDAEVATHSVIRAPHKLNVKRERAGKTPLLDYHVVDLSRRHRISNPSNAGAGGKKRLHFRRGHWRHYETSKTWVKWCLVGDPDLGFIQKQYSL